MKYCLNARQSESYLQKADEILIEARDYKVTPDILVAYPEKTVILDINFKNIDQLSMKTLKNYAEMSDNFVCRLSDLRDYYEYKKNSIKFYYGYPVNTYAEVKALIDLGVKYVNITAPLTFDVDLLRSIKTKFRVVPNIAYYDFIPRKDGITGDYIRPEDVKYYEDAIYVFDFENVSTKQEEGMYDVYTKGTWVGDISLLITNLKVSARNPALPDEFGEYRSKCKQRCYNCHYCESAFNLAKAADEYYEKNLKK